jgi:hypothetical protein
MNSKEAIREQWKNHVEAWKASGKSCQTWANENNLSYHSLLYWRQKYAERAPAAAKTFVELRDQTKGISLEIAGVIVRVNPSFDPATLIACIELLRKL